MSTCIASSQVTQMTETRGLFPWYMWFDSFICCYYLLNAHPVIILRWLLVVVLIGTFHFVDRNNTFHIILHSPITFGTHRLITILPYVRYGYQRNRSTNRTTSKWSQAPSTISTILYRPRIGISVLYSWSSDSNIPINSIMLFLCIIAESSISERNQIQSRRPKQFLQISGI